MTLQRRYLLNREVQSSNAATRIVQLPRAGVLSAINLRLECTNGATSGTELLRDAIDRVEVIANGSEVVFSLEGAELERWQYVYLRKRAVQQRTMVAGAVQELFLLVPFGRFLGDPELALDLGAYQSVELRVQYSPTISATTFATGTFTITAILHFWAAGEATGARRGYIRTTQFRSFTSAASGEDVTELPRKNPILDILVHAREAGVADGTDITLAEVREDDGLVVPYTGRWLDIQAENLAQLGFDPTEEGIALLTDAETVDTLVNRIQHLNLALLEDAAAADAVTPQLTVGVVTGDRVTVSILETDEDGTTAASALATALYRIYWSARGNGIGNAIFIPLWDLKDLATAYPAPSKSKVALALTNGGADAAVRASLRELVAA